jgi:hypothetical protein
MQNWKKYKRISGEDFVGSIYRKESLEPFVFVDGGEELEGRNWVA